MKKYTVHAEISSGGTIWLSIRKPDGSLKEGTLVGFENPTEELVRAKKLELEARCKELNIPINESEAIFNKVFGGKKK